MKRAIFVVLLASLMESMAIADPSLFVVGDPVNFGNGKVGFTVAINWNDAQTSSAYFALDVAGTNGSTIQQQDALATS